MTGTPRTRLTSLANGRLSQALVQRTIANLDYIKAAAGGPAPRADVHVVAAILDAALAIIQPHFDGCSEARRSLDQTALPYAPDQARSALLRLFAIPSLEIHSWAGSQSVRAFLQRLHSGLSHHRIEVHGDYSDFPDPSRLVITVFDGFRIADWRISLTASDLEIVIRTVASTVLDE